MATYNGAAHLQEQLASLAMQTQLPVEVQVGDDGSTDSTIAILQEFAASAPFPVMITSNPTQLGYGENFMQAAKRCSGEWIAFCDQDDVWLPEKLARCAAIIASADERLRLVVHNATVTDDKLVAIGPLDKGPFGTFDQLALSPYWFAHGFRMVFQCGLIANLPIETRPMGWLSYTKAHDNWIAMAAAISGTIVSTADELVQYRRHAQTATGLMISKNPDVTDLMTNNGLHYRNESKAFAELADYVAAARAASGQAEWQGPLGSSYQAVNRYARMLAARADLYLDGALSARIAALLKLVAMQAYWGSNGWHLPLRSAAKDLFSIFSGRRTGAVP